MLQKFIDDFRESAGSALRLTSLAVAVAISLFITTSFLCAAAFVFVLEQYGLLQACLAGAGVFFVATLLAAICYAVRKRQVRRKPVEQAKSAMQTALSDPMMLAAGLQIVRTIGIKRLIPIIAVGGIALGVLASRRAPGDQPDE
ncbi:MAG: hypothetical protein V4661_09610 [Pseudomonadota bacterium]